MNPYDVSAHPILAIERETEIDWTFTIGYDTPVRYGQFLEVSLPGIGEAPISISAVDHGRLYLTIRKVGRLTNALFECRVGDSVYLRGPYGNGFDIDSFTGRNLVVLAGGTGLAPVRGLIRHYVQHQEQLASFTVIAGFKTPDDILFGEELARWRDRIDLTVTVDKGNDNWKGPTGLITEFVPALSALRAPDACAVVVGPPLMMKFTTLELVKNGLPEEAITLSFERTMSCGIGKCGHCKIDDTYVCIDGPVFPYSKAKRLID